MLQQDLKCAMLAGTFVQTMVLSTKIRRMVFNNHNVGWRPNAGTDRDVYDILNWCDIEIRTKGEALIEAAGSLDVAIEAVRAAELFDGSSHGLLIDGNIIISLTEISRQLAKAA